MSDPCFRCGSRISCGHRKTDDSPIIYADVPPAPDKRQFHTAWAAAKRRDCVEVVMARLADQLRPARG